MNLQSSGLSSRYGGASRAAWVPCARQALCLRPCRGLRWRSFRRRVLRSSWVPAPQGIPVRWAERPAWRGPCRGCGDPCGAACDLGKVLGCADWRAIAARREPAGQWWVPGDWSSGCGFRQALVDRYSKLSAEAARREQKALWKIQRHRLASARLRFLLEDQERIQVPLWFWAVGTQNPRHCM